MIDWATLIGAAATVLLTAPAGYMAIKKKVEQSLFRRLEDISGGQVATLEDLVADALQQKRLKNSDIVVYGPSNLWAELRRYGFSKARMVNGNRTVASVAVIDINEFVISESGGISRASEDSPTYFVEEPYVLIYSEGPYRGPKPPGAFLAYANSQLTLHARIMEALRHMNDLSEDR